MARVSKEITFTGTVGDITFYRWEDRIFARKKSSLTKERVMKEKEFAGLRKHAGDMGRASKLASEVYKSLPADIKGRWIFRAIAGDAASLLYKGKTEEQVKASLQRKYLIIPIAKEKRTIKTTINNKDGSSGLITVSSKTANKHWKHIFLKRWENQGKKISVFESTWEHREPFRPDTIPRRAEYFFGLKQASGLK